MNIRISLDIDYPSNRIKEEGVVNLTKDIEEQPSILGWLYKYKTNIKVEFIDDFSLKMIKSGQIAYNLTIMYLGTWYTSKTHQ